MIGTTLILTGTIMEKSNEFNKEYYDDDDGGGYTYTYSREKRNRNHAVCWSGLVLLVVSLLVTIWK